MIGVGRATRAENSAHPRRGYFSADVNPSRIAYFVSSAMVRSPSFCVIWRRWVSTVGTAIPRTVGAVVRDLELESVPFPEISGQPHERVHEPEVVEDGRAEVEDQCAFVHDRLLEERDGRVHGGSRIAGELRTNRRQLDFRERERLSDAVVELDRQAAPLALFGKGGFERHALEIFLVLVDLPLGAFGRRHVREGDQDAIRAFDPANFDQKHAHVARAVALLQSDTFRRLLGVVEELAKRRSGELGVP
jgi:hypothetical protein